MLDFGKKSGQSCFVSSTLCSFTWHCLLSPWSRPLSDTEQKIIKSWSNSRLHQFFNEDGKQHKPGHRQCNRRRAQHPPWCRPQCCTFSSLKWDKSKKRKFWVEIISNSFFTSPWPPVSAAEPGCRAWCSQAAWRGRQTGRTCVRMNIWSIALILNYCCTYL